jgi:kinetochore protein Spc7/SPC105
VSPVRNIPSFEETRRRTPARGSQYADNQGNEQGKEGLLIDFDTPARPSASGSEDPSNPFDSFNASSIRDEMAAAREREEKERRERERKAILEQREARRKSMGMILSSCCGDVTNCQSEPSSIVRPRSDAPYMERR